MPQDTGTEIARAAVGIDQSPVFVERHRIDRQIATLQIRFESHVRRRMENKSAVAGRGLALGACQGVLLVRFRMQKDGEVLADGSKAARDHFVGRAADNDPVAIGFKSGIQIAAAAPVLAEQRVAYAAADPIELHP